MRHYFFGAAGIVFPQIDTAAQAEAAVHKVRYPYGGGTRSASPLALLDGITNLAPEGWTAETIADRNIAVICQIESVINDEITDQTEKLGIENVDAIAKTPGVNALMVGVGDLKATLDLPIRNPDGRGDDSKFYSAVAKMVTASKNYGMPLMIPAFRTNPDDVDWLRDFKLVLTSVDILGVVKAHRQDLALMKKVLRVPASSGHRNGHQNAHQNGHQNGHQNLNQNRKQNGNRKDL
ncbi:Pyruvate/Phosphoenolpyruvate kinase-like domain-containing protein [Xylogone sp. PMI_703]|nr:Pyruvate/Phosphoenolpyruvate kinase-like domain-containing protein [Xylogone sp. PMI_703]